MSVTSKRHFQTIALATLVIGAGALSPAFAGSASSTRPPSGSSGGTVSHGGSSSSGSSSRGSHDSGSSSHGSSSSSSAGSWSRDSGRTRVDGVARWHQGSHGRGSYNHGAYWRGSWGGWYSPWYYGPWSIGWWGYWGPYSYYYDTPPYWNTRVYPNDDYGTYGALDLDVSPERAEVYVNGERIGKADDYDGYPTYLWLEQGVYDVVFYLQGYETIARQYVIRPGLVIDVEDTMTPGASVRPEDLPAKSHEHRDERLRQNREVEEDAARGIPPGYPQGQEPWRARVHPLDRPEADTAGSDAPRRGATEDARLAPARLKVDVEPGDASVYLDGRFVGTGAELEQLPNGLLIDAGPHRIEAVRPGRKPVSKEFTAEPGGDAEVDLTLTE